MSEPLKTIHVLENADTSYGGPAHSVPRMIKRLRDHEVEGSIFAVRRTQLDNNDYCEKFNIDISWERAIGPASVLYAPAMEKNLTQQVDERTILHCHYLWTYPTMASYRVHRDRKIPLVISVRSNLFEEALRRGNLGKSVAWLLFVERALSTANCLHVTSEHELSSVRHLGIETPAALIPQSVDAQYLEKLPPRAKARRNLELGEKRKTILFISNLHPRKGVLTLVDSFAEVAKDFPDWDLLIGGREEDHEYAARVHRRVQQKQLSDRVFFAGMLRGDRRQDAFAASDLFVLPSKFENFGVMIAEALGAGLPVITTMGTPWSELHREKIGWWVQDTVESISRAMRRAFSLPDKELKRMGKASRKHLIKNYAFESVAEKWVELYRWLVDDTDRPDFVDVVSESEDGEEKK